MRNIWIFASVLAAAIGAAAPPAQADLCADSRYVCNDPTPECWFNSARSEYACSARGWNHCASRFRSYSCEPPTNCLGDGSAPRYCTSLSRFITPRRLPNITPAGFSYVPARPVAPSSAP